MDMLNPAVDVDPSSLPLCNELVISLDKTPYNCVMTLRLLAALLPNGNKRRSESSRHLIRGCPYTATGRMPYMETGTFCLRKPSAYAKRDVY